MPVASKSECLVAGKELGLTNQPSRSYARVQGRFTLVTKQPKAPVLDAPSGTVGPIGCYVKERGAGAQDDQRFFFATASVGKKDAQLDGCCKRPFGHVSDTKLFRVVGDKAPNGQSVQAEFVNGLMLVCRNPNLKTRSVNLRRRRCLVATHRLPAQPCPAHIHEPPSFILSHGDKRIPGAKRCCCSPPAVHGARVCTHVLCGVDSRSAAR